MPGTQEPQSAPPEGAVPRDGPIAPESAASAAARWMDQHADVLWRFVLSRVGSEQAAEDLVQETLLAALQSFRSFAGDSSERTWLLGIASHKIADHFRRQGRASHRPDDDQRPCACDVCRALFSSKGMWARFPGEWEPGPTEADRASAREALRGCIESLSEGQREAMWLRDVLGVPIPAICKAMGITATNLWTRLHRARSAVRSCLQGKLGSETDGPGPPDRGSSRPGKGGCA